jgi:ribose transport system substrate-binding protein
MEIIAEASCEFDAAKQLTDIENFIPLKPDVIISSPIDQVGSAQAFRPALDAGIKLAFVSNIPEGYVKGKDYIGNVTVNAYDLGAFGFELLYERVGSGGKVAGIFMDTTYWLDNYLTAVFKKKVEESDLELVTWRGYVTYDDALTQANAIISTYPDVKGIWTNWIQSGQAVVNAAENAGRDDIVIIAGGYDEPTLLNMVDGKLHGIFSDATYLVGFNSILLAAYGFLGKEGPDYAVGPAVKINVDNMREIWAAGLRIPFPKSVDEALKAVGK